MDSDQEDPTEFEKMREERQREVDRLSLELLSNTKQYKKYIAKNHPEERIRRTEDNRRFLKYKSRVASLFLELLEEYEDLGSTSLLVGTELQEQFKECVQKTIQHLEWKECSATDGEAADEDILFGHAYKPSPKKKSSAASSSPPFGKKDDPFSYWGATITKSQDH
jgi:sugar-specific transcriptional regulator TrmB